MLKRPESHMLSFQASQKESSTESKALSTNQKPLHGEIHPKNHLAWAARSTAWKEGLELSHLYHSKPPPRAQILIKFQSELIECIFSTQEVKDNHQPIGPNLSTTKKMPGKADSMDSLPQCCCRTSGNWEH